MKVAKQELMTANDPVPLAPSQGNGGLVQVLGSILRDPNIPMERIEKVWEMVQRIEQQTAKTAWHEAMTEAQKEMRMVVKDQPNSQTKSNYASFAALDAEIRPIYTKHGFGLTYDTGEGGFGPIPENHVRTLCEVMRGPYSRLYHFDIPADGKGAKGGDVMSKTHAAASAFKYGRRLLLEGIFNIATGDRRDDDDGNAAGALNEGGDLISVAQLQEIVDLADDLRVPKELICEQARVDGLAQLTVEQFRKVKRKFELAKQKRAAKA